MKKWIIGLSIALVFVTGMSFIGYSQPIPKDVTYEMSIVEVYDFDYSIDEPSAVYHLPGEIDLPTSESNLLGSTKDGISWVNEATLKVAIYSVPLREENKVVLVKDPKGFVERAIRHGMEYLAIKPMDKGDEFWETVPVFSVEKNLSFQPKTTTETVPEDSELLRLIPVADFIRYN